MHSIVYRMYIANTNSCMQASMRVCIRLYIRTSLFYLRTAMIAGVIAFLFLFAYIFGIYLPQVAEMHRTGLPQEPDYFVNREQEQEKMMQSITGSISHRSRIITITGSPGYGKTTLANVCGHRFVSQGIPVRYVDLQHVCTIKGIVVKILYAIGSTATDPSMEQLRRWAGQRHNGVLVLVLDNVDCFTLSGEGLKKKFSDLIKDFIVKPSLAIHVILTTQYQLGYIDSFQLIALDRLSDAHAKELLLHRNPSLTSNVTTTLANFTDGNPLALQILSAVLHMPNAPPISALLEQLQHDPVEILSPDSVHEKLNHVFKVAIGYLSDADHQCFLAVCQFPGSFDEALASAVLPHFVNETVPACLRHLLARSLLEYNRNTGRYAVLPLLKTFVNSTSQNYSVMVSQFFPVYVKHLLQTATKKQSISEVHLQNYLKANYLETQYLINGYVSWSNNVSDFDTNVDLILPFALSTFNMLPLLQPVDVVEEFWMAVQKLTWNITSKGLEGQCHECFEKAIEFETMLADYVLSTGRNDTMETVRLLSRAQALSVQVDKLQSLTASNCTRIVTLLRYLGQVAKYSCNEAVYQNLLKAIMLLASNKNHSSADALYNIGVIYFELNEYNLAIEFLNRSLTGNSSAGIQHLNAVKTMVLAYHRNGQQELAVDTLTRLLPSSLEQVSLEATSTYIEQSVNHLNATDLNPDHHYEKVVQITTETLDRIADTYFTLVDLSITVNDTALSLVLLNHTTDVFFTLNISLSPTIEYFSKHCHDEPSKDPLSQLLWQTQCLEIANNNNFTRLFLVKFRFQLYQMRVVCDMSKALMKIITQCSMHNDLALNQSRHVTQLFSYLVDLELDRKRMRACSLMETDSVECQMSRRQVRLLWQLQYELADCLAMSFCNLGMLEQAKEYTEITLEKLPKSSVKKKWKVMVDHKLNLAKIELSLGNYWNAMYILRNCSLTIDEQMMETAYKATRPSPTWQSHDLSFPDGNSFVLVYQFYHVFNATKVLAAVVSGALSCISHAGIGITVTHLLFVAIVAILWSLVFTILLLLGSALYCLKCICSCSLDRHRCWDKFRLLFFNLIIVMCAFSHIVVFYSYVLHFHTTVLLTYLNYII